jgi:hypothetical protein
VQSRRSRWFTQKVEPFGSERTLCDVLRDAARKAGWTFYPETGGWDALLVLEDETQIGVQAKLRANVDVLAQAIVPARQVGPDVHVVLVPSCSRAFRDVAETLGIGVLIGDVLRGEHARVAGDPSYLERVISKAPRTTHLPGRCWLPPFVPDGPAGVPAPRAVSQWRVAAARLCAELRKGYEPTNEEIRKLGMSPSTWYQWLDPVAGTKPRRYAPRPGCSLPDVAFPEVCRGLGLPEPARVAA